MAIIANNIVLKPNMSKESEGFAYYKEYKDAVSQLKADYPSGSVTLRRIGYPRLNEMPSDSAMPSMPEVPPPIYLSPAKDKGGVMWMYCEGAPKIEANGQATLPKNYELIDLSGEIINVEFEKKPDYGFFVLYVSGVIGSQFEVYNPEGDRIKEAEEKNRKLKVQFAIRESLSEEKLRTIAAAWGIADAHKKLIILLQEELESRIFSNEEAKKHDPMNPALKGVGEFLAEAKNDDLLRPRALIQFGIDEGRFKYELSRYKWLFDDNDVCDVPINKVEDRVSELVKFLAMPKNKVHWVEILKSLLSEEYLEKVDKYAVRYFCEELEIPLNQKEPALRTALLEAIKQE